MRKTHVSPDSMRFSLNQLDVLKGCREGGGDCCEYKHAQGAKRLQQQPTHRPRLLRSGSQTLRSTGGPPCLLSAGSCDANVMCSVLGRMMQSALYSFLPHNTHKKRCGKANTETYLCQHTYAIATRKRQTLHLRERQDENDSVWFLA